MIIRVRQPGGINRDSENVPSQARVHVNRFSLGGVLATGGATPSADHAAREARRAYRQAHRDRVLAYQRAYLARQRGAA